MVLVLHICAIFLKLFEIDFGPLLLINLIFVSVRVLLTFRLIDFLQSWLLLLWRNQLILLVKLSELKVLKVRLFK